MNTQHDNAFGARYSMDSQMIFDNLNSLNDELFLLNVKGEIALVGGAVMCLVFKSRESTYDIDAIFEPKKLMYDCIKKVAEKKNLAQDWINDSVKGFLSSEGEFIKHLEFSNLNVLVASPEYMLAMKCLSSRTDSPYELEDIRFLLSYLKLKTFDDVLNIISKYYKENRFLPKTRYVIQEVLDELHNA